MGTRQRLIELDILRALGIVCVLAGHALDYVPAAPWARSQYALTTLGVGLFTFVSGFALAYSSAGAAPTPSMRFLKQRLGRIYPLYIPALLIFVALFYYLKLSPRLHFKPVIPNLAAHLFSMQALLSPLVTPSFTLWFIGMIVPFYVFFMLIVRCKTARQAALTIILIPVLLLMARFVFGIVDVRILLYYPVFIAGILLSRLGVLSSRRLDYRLALLGLAVSALAYVAFQNLGMTKVLDESCGRNQIIACAPDAAIILTYMLSAIVFLLWISSRWTRHMPDPVRQAILFVSFSSYAVYLYHRPLLLTFGWLTTLMTFGVAGRTVLLVGLMILLFPIGYGLQNLQDRLQSKAH